MVKSTCTLIVWPCLALSDCRIFVKSQNNRPILLAPRISGQGMWHQKGFRMNVWLKVTRKEVTYREE